MLVQSNHPLSPASSNLIFSERGKISAKKCEKQPSRTSSSCTVKLRHSTVTSSRIYFSAAFCFGGNRTICLCITATKTGSEKQLQGHDETKQTQLHFMIECMDMAAVLKRV